MATVRAPQLTQDQRAQQPGLQRGLTVRSVVITIFALLLMGMWIEYEECFVTGGPLAENSPPNSAIGVILILLIIGALLYRFRRSFGLIKAELVVVYCALLVAAPLMTQGMWHRIFGLMAAIPHEQDFKSYESLPTMLWPHGPNLVQNPNFDHKLQGFEYLGRGQASWEMLEWKGKKWSSPVLQTSGSPTDKTSIRFTIDRFTYANMHDTHGGRVRQAEILVPGESFLLSLLVKADDLQSTSSYFVMMQADDNRPLSLLRSATATSPTIALPGGFQRIGVCPITIPKSLKEKFNIEVGISGPGKLALQDVQFFNVQAVEGLYTGRKVVQARHYGQLKENERDFTIARPDNMFSAAGLSYLVHGFIPLRQWIMPALAWTMLIGALFIGFLGFNVLMRRQWVESERFTFPLNLLPRHLFGDEEGADGVRGIFRNKVMWIGFAVMLPIVLLKGIHFYQPAIPAPNLELPLSTMVTHPLLKAYLQNVNISVTFCLLTITLLVETDILFSIWASFLLFQFMFLFGKAFNFNRYAGYPWEMQQAIGSFIGFAVVAVYAGRRHLAQVFKHVIGKKTPLDDSKEVISYRAALLFIALSVALIVAWGAWTKMGPWVSLLFFGWMLLCGFTASKVRAEAGMPFGYWMPYFGMMFVSAVGGFAVFGTTGMLVATIASGFMCVSCFLFIAPVQVEMMELGRFFKVRPRDIGYGLFLGLLGGLFVGGFVLLCWAYGFGAENFTYNWPYAQNWYFTGYRLGEASADNAMKLGHLVTPQNAPLNFITNVDAKGIGIGFLVTLLLSFLRSTFMWFPLHPLGYVLATTYFARGAWCLAFIAWLTRIIVLRIGGAHSIRKGLVPFCIGMFLACIVSVIFFDVVSMYLRAHGVIDVYNKWP